VAVDHLPSLEVGVEGVVEEEALKLVEGLPW